MLACWKNKKNEESFFFVVVVICCLFGGKKGGLSEEEVTDSRWLFGYGGERKMEGWVVAASLPKIGGETLGFSNLESFHPLVSKCYSHQKLFTPST